MDARDGLFILITKIVIVVLLSYNTSETALAMIFFRHNIVIPQVR